MKSIRLFVAALMASSYMHAGDIDGNTVVGGALGAAAGSAVGSAIGGKEGAIIGAGAGGVIGAAIASDREPRRYDQERVIIRDRGDNPNVHYDQGRHLGHYKKKHKNKYKYEHNRDRDNYRDYDRNRERYYEHDRGYDRDRYRGREW
ncbi:MAG: hypothetical protein PHO62_07385 [Sulfurimonas sp.]|uniref:glycine zipper domain-containing protein n=1 Tax=Sulfurimonas sp. TaxID=2022749 RepID=UPI00261C5678|nr:glycine zipper domain-containing protein [Sulfurimonas sp.]MDD5373233.1 hypothetical protein [Sulfurimonas sp.]